ncbi:Potassium transporter KimA [Sporomusa rhizae]|uniref:hypothetical protein n=1 Tax=Sporomusa rhizae TaxID=357999 RepID=UPI003A767683
MDAAQAGMEKLGINYAQFLHTGHFLFYLTAAQKVQEKWQQWNPDVELVTIYSPYRLVIGPLVNYVERLERKKEPDDFITVVIPEFETRKWWHRLLHNQTGFILRTLLILNKNVIVTTIPFHLHK